MRVALVDVYLRARSRAHLLRTAHVVEVTVREQYLRQAELLHTHIFEQYARASADVYGYTARGSSLHEVAVGVELTELKGLYSHCLLLYSYLSVQLHLISAFSNSSSQNRTIAGR